MGVKNLIFLTMARMTSIEYRGIYTDLLRCFRNEGWNVYVVSPHERSLGIPTELTVQDGVHFLGVKTFNLQKTSTIEKGIGQVLIERQYKRSIRRFLPTVKFDLILYSTPPITFPKVIAYLKRCNPQALTYLLLKDIFPQNAVDLGMLSESGLKGILYSFFRLKEKRLYALSDYIGCMSMANVEYVLAHNSDISDDRVEVAPNSIELSRDYLYAENDSIRAKYHIPLNVPVFIYGGNLGKPQGIPFLMECLEANADRDDCHFVVVGTGTELPKLKRWFNARKPKSVTVMDGLPKVEYDKLVRSCDVGLIFLDHRFTIPNFPSRLLSYLEYKMPVLCATDPVCDMGKMAVENGFGLWCESDSVEAFTLQLDRMIHADRVAMGEKGYAFLCENYLVENTYHAIVKHV